MADLVNLNRVRKEKAKAAAKRQAEANRVAYGRPKAAKEAKEAAGREADKQRRELDGKKIEDPDG